MDTVAYLAGAVFLAILCAWAGIHVGRSRERARRERERAEAGEEAARILEDARQQAEATKREAEAERKSAQLEGREEAYKLREAWEQEEARRREELERSERRVTERSDSLDRKFDQLNERDTALETRASELEGRERAVDERERHLAQQEEQAKERLQELAGLSHEEAHARVLEEVQEEAQAEAQNRIREIREEAERTAARESKHIIGEAIQRMAAEETANSTVSVVQLPSDEMKGRIIGREGRNIRSFEQATGIDVIIDDTPEAVVLSGFDPFRREVARIAMEWLVEDGRIHPGRIEEVVEKAQEEVDRTVVEDAEQALYDLGIHDVNPEIVRCLGRLRYRTSYGQNQLLHSREVARLAGNMAKEMGLDVQLARRAGLLHDVGKGLTQEKEGTHVELGWELCRRHGEPDVVLNAIKAHHDEEPHRYPETFLVTAADAISGSRPGARRELFDTYVKRLEQLEALASEHEGVERCFAVQAGREVRIMVEPGKVDDEEMARISQEVARRFEEELQYPGQIKVVVIRETRTVDFAR